MGKKKEAKVAKKGVASTNKTKVLSRINAAKSIIPERLNEMIAKKAYELYSKRGNTPGGELTDWLKAEEEIKKSYTLK